MKILQYLASALIITALLFACKKEQSREDGQVPVVEDDLWEFTEAGVLKKGPTDSAYIQTVANVTTLSIVGSSTENQAEVFLQIVTENLTTGSYTNPLVFFQYGENGTVVFQSSPVQTNGFTINITELDSSLVAGTFSGTALDGQGVEHTIAEGKFTASISSWEGEPEPVEEGVLTVWAKEICTDGEPIKISVAGQSGEIIDGLAQEPACGAVGAVSFTLPAGNHVVEAICGTDTLVYEVSIVGECNMLEVDFANPPTGDYLPLGIGSYWNYNDIDDATRTQRITADAEEVLEGRRYTRFVSTLNDTFYYRKDQNAYYQYRVFDFENFIDNPPTVEVPILYDDRAAGATWETEPENITLSGIPVKAKLVFTITRRDFAASLNGVNYTDLIEVNTEIFFSSDGGASYQSSQVAYNTVFAKGNGIVYYYDIENDVEWIINQVVLVP
jgi:hypothetical protein